MTTRKLILPVLLTLAALGTFQAPPAQARGFVALSVGIAPPPPRVERMVVRPGWVWAPGWWRWAPRLRHYVWVRGHWMPARPGWHWVGPRWVPRGPRWVFRAGHWAR